MAKSVKVGRRRIGVSIGRGKGGTDALIIYTRRDRRPRTRRSTTPTPSKGAGR